LIESVLTSVVDGSFAYCGSGSPVAGREFKRAEERSI
jgi:hypothetical protein